MVNFFCIFVVLESINTKIEYMKRLLLILCCVALLAACSEEEKRPATAKAPERYGLDWQLFGDVESLTINSYDATTKFGEVVTEFDSATFYQFNAAGDVTECVIDCEESEGDIIGEGVKYEYNSDGKISRMVESTTYYDIDNYEYTTAEDVTTYRYNAEGLCSQRVLCYNSGMSMMTTFKYDDKGRETEWRSYDSDGALDEVCKKVYDSKGNIIRQTHYNNDGSEKSCATYKYDKRGKCIELVSESDYWCRRYTYRYNSQGLMTAQRVYDGDEYALESEFRLKYNAAGALIESQRISYDNLDTDVYDYKITIDKHNNITRIDSYENGDIISVTEVDIVYR